MAEPSGFHQVAQLQRELAANEHQLSELEVILADYGEERARLVREIGRLQTRLRDLEEQRRSEFPHGKVEPIRRKNDR